MENSQDDPKDRCRKIVDSIFEALSKLVNNLPGTQDEVSSIVTSLRALVKKSYHNTFQAYAGLYLLSNDKEQVEQLHKSLQAAYDSLETCAEMMKDYTITVVSRLHNNWQNFELHFMTSASLILPSKKYEALALFSSSTHEKQKV